MRPRRRKTDWAVVLAFLALVAASFVSWRMAGEALDKVEHNRIAADHAMSAAAIERTAQIEESRRDVLIRSCREQNARYDRTVRVLDERLAALPPETRARAAESRAFTVALIEGLAPRRHCIKRADRLTR